MVGSNGLELHQYTAETSGEVKNASNYPGSLSTQNSAPRCLLSLDQISMEFLSFIFMDVNILHLLLF